MVQVLILLSQLRQKPVTTSIYSIKSGPKVPIIGIGCDAGLLNYASECELSQTFIRPTSDFCFVKCFVKFYKITAVLLSILYNI